MALTPSAELIIFSPNEKEYKEIAKIKVAGSSTYAYPVPIGKQLLVKDQDSVSLLNVN